MANRRSPETPIVDTVDQYLSDISKGDDDNGSYRRDAKRELTRFLDWCRGDIADFVNSGTDDDWTGILDVQTPGETPADVRFADLDATVFGDYARYLSSRRGGKGPLAASTIRTYYAYVAAWCRWAHKQGWLEQHYARAPEAEGRLPDDPGQRSDTQQAWTPEQRDQLTTHVDERAQAALDRLAEHPVDVEDRGDLTADAVRERAAATFDAVQAFRARALVYILSYTGLRAAEFLNHPDDTRDGRNGLRWEDISFTDQHLTVFRKTQEWDEAALPEPVADILGRYQRLLDPPEDWPVFTTLHRPTLSNHVTEYLSEAVDGDDDRVAELRDAKHDLLVAAEHDLSPPPGLRPNGARRVMERLCDDAGVTLPEDDAHGYLAPHGGRRGMGEVMVRTFGYAEAARYLQNSEQQVREAYQHIEASEQAAMATAALSETDQRVQAPDAGGDDDHDE